MPGLRMRRIIGVMAAAVLVVIALAAAIDFFFKWKLDQYELNRDIYMLSSRHSGRVPGSGVVLEVSSPGDFYIVRQYETNHAPLAAAAPCLVYGNRHLGIHLIAGKLSVLRGVRASIDLQSEIADMLDAALRNTRASAWKDPDTGVAHVFAIVPHEDVFVYAAGLDLENPEDILSLLRPARPGE